MSLSLKKYGAVATPIIDEATGNLVVGHGRVAALRALRARGDAAPKNIQVRDGKWFAPVLRGNHFKDKESATAYLIDDNNLTLAGSEMTALDMARIWDMDGYAELLANLATHDALPVTVDGDDLDLLIDQYTKEQASEGGASGEDRGEELTDKADALQKKWKVKFGDVWEIPSLSAPGNVHRLVCGDSTNADTFAVALNGQKIQMLLTDPPWNVAYGSSKNPRWKVREQIKNDNLGKDFGSFLEKAFTLCKANAVPGALTYVFMSAQEWPTLHKVMLDTGYHWSSTIIWVKDHPVLSRKDYHTQYEPIWYGWADGAPRLVRLEDRKQSDAWMFDRPLRSDEHPTMKPVPLLERAIQNSSKPGFVVFDAFAGSGGYFQACEGLRRVAHGIELLPKYVSVILERLTLMGLAPVRVVEGDGNAPDVVSIDEPPDTNDDE